MYSLLNAVAASWPAFINGMTGLDDSQRELLGSVFNIISIVLWVALALVGAIGGIYAIYLGVQLSKADEQGKRDDAKKHLITVVIAIGVTLALILVFNIFLPMLLDAFKVGSSTTQGGDIQGGGGEDFIKPFFSMIKCRI